MVEHLISTSLGTSESLALITSKMPGERRTLRSNKDAASSTNGEKARSDSQSSASNKDKPLPARSTSSKGKAGPAKKGLNSTSAKGMATDKTKANGSEPAENGTNGVEDVEMADDAADKTRPNGINEGEEEMTVVVPPPNSSKLSSPPAKDEEGDIAMDDTHPAEAQEPAVEVVDPKVKAVSGK